MDRSRSLCARTVTVVVALGFLAVSSTAWAQFQTLKPAATVELTPTLDTLSVWDEIDQQVGLAGLWGSITPYWDVDPYLFVRPSDQELFLVWAKWNGNFREIVYASRPAGGTWSGIAGIEATPSSVYDNRSPVLVSDTQDRLHVSWVRKSPQGGILFHVVDVGDQWTAFHRVSAVGEDASSPVPFLVEERVRLRYSTDDALITVEIEVVATSAEVAGDASSGGSDDLDPFSVQSHMIDIDLLAP